MTLCDILWSLGSAIYNAGCALIRYCYLKNSLRVELQVLISYIAFHYFDLILKTNSSEMIFVGGL